LEHLNEFAIVKAIGGRNADVLAVIAKQAVIAALFGYVLGAMLTYAARDFVEVLDLKLDVRPQLLPALRRSSIGFVFQQFHLFPALSAAENVEYALNLKGVKGSASRREAARLLGEIGLSDRATFLPRDLSGGQKQRVAIARALRAGLRSSWPTSRQPTSTPTPAPRFSTCSRA
jgi:ABC-type uncharacterized transport system YnjBCD ATPase subunit